MAESMTESAVLLSHHYNKLLTQSAVIWGHYSGWLTQSAVKNDWLEHLFLRSALNMVVSISFFRVTIKGRLFQLLFFLIAGTPFLAVRCCSGKSTCQQLSLTTSVMTSKTKGVLKMLLLSFQQELNNETLPCTLQIWCKLRYSWRLNATVWISLSDLTISMVVTGVTGDACHLYKSTFPSITQWLIHLLTLW